METWVFKLVFSIWFTCYVTCVARADEGYTRVTRAGKKSDYDISFNIIQDLIRKKDIKTVEGLLESLPKEYLQNYVLMYSSKSEQGASFENPRIVLYGVDGRTVLAFNGASSQAGYSKIELIQFNEKKSTFEFREINFSQDKAHPTKPIISEINPTSCLKCHGNDPRPNWDTYTFWPGAYYSIGVLQSDKEESGIKKFFENRYKNDRYKYLGGPENFTVSGFVEDFGMKISILNLQRIRRIILNSKPLQAYRYAILAALECPYEVNADAIYFQKFESFFPKSILQDVQKEFKIVRDAELNKSLKYNMARFAREKSLVPYERSRQFSDGKPSPHMIEGELRLKFILEIAGIQSDFWSTATDRKVFDFNDGLGGIAHLSEFLWKDFLDPIKDAELYKRFLKAKSYYFGGLDFEKKDRDVLEFQEKRRQRFDAKSENEKICDILRQKSLKTLSNLTVKASVKHEDDCCEVKAIGTPDVSLPEELIPKSKKIPGSCINCHTLGEDPNAPFIAFTRDQIKLKLKNDSAFISNVEKLIKSSSNLRMPPPSSKYPTLTTEQIKDLLDYLNNPTN